MSIGVRFKQLRTTLGHGQREMGRLVGVSQVAWQQYETAKSVPGGSILQSLAEHGVNVHWLLTGQGEVFLAPNAHTSQPTGEVMRQLQRLQQLEGLIQELGLTRLVALASAGHVGDEWAALVLLVENFPDALSLPELASRLAERGTTLEEPRLLMTLELLKHRGLIRQPEGTQTYAAQQARITMKAKDVSGHIQALKSGIQVLCNHVLPGLGRDPRRGRILQIRFPLSETRVDGLLDRLQAGVMEEVTGSFADQGTHEAQLIFGMAIEDGINH